MSASDLSRKPVLFFDSGVGGLSVLAATRKLLPEMPVVYCADNAGFPYGTKSDTELNARVPVLLGRLVERYRPCVVVIACNTASTIALRAVRISLSLPVIGTVPAIKPAAALSRTKVIGVLGTQATVRQAYVDNLVAEFASDCHVLRHGSAELVELAERKLRCEPTDPDAYAAVLACLLNQPGGDAIDSIVLACTHFPLVKDELAAAAPREMNWVDSGDGIARRVQHWTQNISWDRPATGVAVFTATNSYEEALRPALMEYGLTDIDYL
jgi:glutamate racemase